MCTDKSFLREEERDEREKAARERAGRERERRPRGTGEAAEHTCAAGEMRVRVQHAGITQHMCTSISRESSAHGEKRRGRESTERRNTESGTGKY